MQSSAKIVGSKVLSERSSIREYVANNNTIFNKRIAAITNKDYSHIEQMTIFEHRNIPTPHIFFYHAHKYHSNLHEEVEEFIIRQLQQFYNNCQSSYAVAYIHESFIDFLAFRRIIERWPEHFFHRLRRVYIVGPSIMVRLIQTCSFGTFYRFCDELFLNLPDENSLKEADQGVLLAIGESPHPLLNDSIKIEDNSLYGKNLTDYDLHTGKYPVIMLRLLARLVRRPEQLRTEGIFRKSCDAEALKNLEKQLQARHWQAIEEQKDVMVVGGCLKNILYNLPLPLFSYALYQRIVDFSGGDHIQFIRGVLSDMEYVNHKVFVLMVVFITNFVISQKEWNKMNAYNMSVVFYPCFFRPKEYDIKDLANGSKFTKFLQMCLQAQEQLIDPSQLRLAEQILKSLQSKGMRWQESQ